MASIGRWFESEYKIAVQATDNEDREAAQHNLVERANIRVQEIQTLMAIARCFGHEKMKGKMKKDTNRGTTRTGKAEEKACSEARELQDTLRAMHAQSLGLSTPRVLDLGPFLNIDEIFPQVDLVQGQTTVINSLDLNYYPNLRGPYNMDPSVANGTIDNVVNSWAGITRQINTTDFEQSNVEYIEFWLMDPFMQNPSNLGGKLVLNLGNISAICNILGKRII